MTSLSTTYEIRRLRSPSRPPRCCWRSRRSSSRTSRSSSRRAGRARSISTAARSSRYPRLRRALMDFAASTILTEIGYELDRQHRRRRDRGHPLRRLDRRQAELPMQYVRKKAKGFGRKAQIEGEVVAGARILLVEDLATDGRSKVNFCNALREGRRHGRPLLRDLPLRHLPEGRRSWPIWASSCTRSRPGGTCWRWPRRATPSMPRCGEVEASSTTRPVVRGARRRPAVAAE